MKGAHGFHVQVHPSQRSDEENPLLAEMDEEDEEDEKEEEEIAGHEGQPVLDTSKELLRVSSVLPSSQECGVTEDAVARGI